MISPQTADMIRRMKLSAISEAIMDRIIHNAFDVTVGGRISMRERHGLNAPDQTSN